MPEGKYILIVASPRPRVGKTLLARVLADHCTLIGEPRRLFDTDATDARLTSYFPQEATLVDLDRVPDQMKLFDSLATDPHVSRIIDLTHRSFEKFFDLARDIGIISEARTAGMKVVIFYIPDSEPESYAQGVELRERFRDCRFIVVKNEAIGSPNRDAFRSPGYQALAEHIPNVLIRQLNPLVARAVEDVRLSLSDFMRRTATPDAAPPAGPLPLAYLSFEARNGISAWLQSVFNEVRRALRDADLQAQILAHERFGA